MIRKNYHTHTYRCGHAVGMDEDYVREGIALGLSTLGFSDHIMLQGLHQPNVRGEFERSEDYFSSINNLKVKYRDRLEIFLGYEAEAFPQYFDYYKYLLDTKTIDYLILGNHCTIEEGVIRSYFTRFTEKKDIIEYTDSLIAGMETGLFCCVCHPDLFMDSYTKWDLTTIMCTRRIINASIKLDIPLEYNFGSIRRGKVNKGNEVRWGYPYLPFWKMVEASKAKVILGLDAHAPSDLTTYLNDEGYAALKDLKLNIIDELKF